jgi:hypothetical protein
MTFVRLFSETNRGGTNSLEFRRDVNRLYMEICAQLVVSFVTPELQSSVWRAFQRDPFQK